MIRTPTGPLSVILPVAKHLLDTGVISGTLDGDLHAADAATVKAAIAAGGYCDFCSAQGATHIFDVPDFDLPIQIERLPQQVSTGGWLACDECAELVKAEKKAKLLDRALAGLSFSKWTRVAVEELHNRFWTAMNDRSTSYGVAKAIAEFVDDKLPSGVKPVLTERDKRIEAMARVIGLTPGEVELVTRGELDSPIMAKLVKWRRTYTGKGGQPIDSRILADLLGDAGPKKPLADVVPHWQRALDARFNALSNLVKLIESEKHTEYFPDPTDLNNPDAVRALMKMAEARKNLKEMGFNEDVRYLKAAQAYSFNDETVSTIREAAKTIPHDSPLSSIETPNTGAGWFWFATPLPIVASSVASDHVHGLLWGWSNGRNDAGSEPALMFSAYVKDDRGQYAPKGTISPSTRWYWPLSATFHEMIQFNSAAWRASYGPGAPLENDPHVMGEKMTLECVAELSLFFVMACVWFKQTVPVLTKESGHIERHAKKRYVREHKLKEPPTVQVVALRKSLRVPAENAEPERREGVRQYNCRWIVKGHPRLQACGPGRKDRKLIWIEAHPAGPDDKPLRTREKVYAVIR